MLTTVTIVSLWWFNIWIFVIRTPYVKMCSIRVVVISYLNISRQSLLICELYLKVKMLEFTAFSDV